MVISLDARSQPAYEIGAQLDALLCYPSFSPERQLRIANAICAKLMRGWIALEPERREELQLLRRDYAAAANRASLGTLEKRRRQALVAGQSFLPMIKEAATGNLPVLNGIARELSRNEIATYLWSPREGGHEINYVSRLRDRKENDIWPWYPVAHLAAAYQALARLGAGPDDDVPFDYQDLEFHRRAVMLADAFAEFFMASPQVAKIAANLIRIEFVG